MARTFTEEERKILRIVQADLPDSLTPYADIAKEVGGVTEETVMNLLRELKDEGVIRRFGASIKHQRAGWGSNAMVGWRVRGLDVESLGKTASQTPAFPTATTGLLRWKTGRMNFTPWSTGTATKSVSRSSATSRGAWVRTITLSLKASVNSKRFRRLIFRSCHVQPF